MPRTSRRAFAKSIALAGVAVPILAQTPPAPAPAQPPPPPSALGHALAGVVLAESGPHLTADEFFEIEKDMNDAAGVYKRLRDFKLQNGDEPDFTFSANTKRW
jgi:hypothetical protein